MQEMLEKRVWSLGWEDPLEEEITTHSSILAWEIPWTEEPAGPQSMGLQRVRYDWPTKTTKGKNKLWDLTALASSFPLC